MELEMHYGNGKDLKRYWTGTGKTLEMSWNGTGKKLERKIKQHHKIPHAMRLLYWNRILKLTQKHT